MPDAVLKIVLLHLAVSLIDAPPIMSHSIDRGHRAGPVPASVAMNENGLVGRIVDQLQKLFYRAVGWSRMVRHRDSEEPHAGILYQPGFILLAALLQVDHRLHAHSSQFFIIISAGLCAAVVPVIYPAEV